MKKIKTIFFTLLASLRIGMAYPIYDAHADYNKNSDDVYLNDIRNNDHNNKVIINDDYVQINGKEYTKNQFSSLLENSKSIYINDLDEDGISFKIAPVAAGIYFIPGIGEVALTVTGGIIIGGVAIAAGNWLYDTCINYFKSHSSNVQSKKS